MIFSLGFRPFFLAALWSATVLAPAWVAMLTGHLPMPTGYYDPIGWHAHEMLHGFVAAAIAGFVLTASANWTGRQTLHGTPLAMLFLLWLAGRLLPFATGVVPPMLVAIVDLSFYPMLIIGYLPPILQSKNHRNLIFVPIMAILWISNLLQHWQALGLGAHAGLGLRIGVYTVAVLMTVVAGRVVPFFTSRAAPGANPQKHPWLERTVIPVTLLAGVAATFPTWLSASTAIAIYIIAATLHIGRIQGWGGREVLNVPLLWILYVGYAWIPVGFILLALTTLGTITGTSALHAFTAGAMGTLILGIITRVSLGHTGRALTPARSIVAAYFFILVATTLRIFGTILNQNTSLILTLSAATWSAAFLITAVHYTPILLAPRKDQKA